jgi:cytosine deaminase
MFDIIVKGGTLPDGRVLDIGIQGTRITAMEKNLDIQAQTLIEAQGDLVSTPFVDPHFHMDATLSYGTPRLNNSGTLLEGISLWGELLKKATIEEMVERGLTYCDWAVSMGLLAIRSHVDTTADHLRTVEAMLEVRQQVKNYLDLQLVAFPQGGFFRAPTGRKNLLRALDMGLDVVGGIPHFERTMEDGRRSVKDLCRIAADRGLLVDMHCDESDDPMSRHVESLAAETTALGMQGRVVGSHLTSMHSMDNYYVSKLLPLMAEAELQAISNPLINITLQGRHDCYPKRRGLTRVREMQAHSIDVGWGQDCVRDPWYALGTADMLDVAFMGMHVAQMTNPLEMARCFKMVTETNAKIMHLEDYGLDVGKQASLVVLDAADPIDALRLRPARLAVISKGKLVSTQPRSDAKLNLPGRPNKGHRRHPVPQLQETKN